MGDKGDKGDMGYMGDVCSLVLPVLLVLLTKRLLATYPKHLDPLKLRYHLRLLDQQQGFVAIAA